MNMTASVMLTGLPRDAHQALADVEAIDAGKGKTRCGRVSWSQLPPFHHPLHISLAQEVKVLNFFHPSTAKLTLVQSPCASSRCHQPRYSKIGCSR
jgi:hypothetical protein